MGQFRELDERSLRFARQIGASGVHLNTPLLPSYPWKVADLRALIAHAAAFGLRLEAIENVPLDAYLGAILATPDRDRCVEDYRETVRNLGAAGIHTLGFHWMACGVERTEIALAGRGGARVSAFDAQRFDDSTRAFDRDYDEQELWATFGSFLADVLPVAEEAGVRLALHPDDPPVPKLRGVARVFRSVDALERAMTLLPSTSLGLDLCLGTISEMGTDPVAAVHRLGGAGHIAYVHFRDVKGTVPSFEECFLGEGNFDPTHVLRALLDVDFDGFLIDDHVPLLDDDPGIFDGWAYQGHAHGTGYLQGLLAGIVTGL